jgi:hypothetical protein
VRLAAAYAARTGSDLQPLFTDLPAPTPAGGRPDGPRSASAPARSRGRRPRFAYAVPVLPLILLVAAVTTVASDGHFPFFVLPLLWFFGGFRRRRSW